MNIRYTSRLRSVVSIVSAVVIGMSAGVAQAQSCPQQTIQWTVSWLGTTCSATAPAAASGSYMYIYDTEGAQTGWAGLQCLNGVWKNSSYECKGPANNNAAPAQPPVFAAPAIIPSEIAAARLLEQATFGPTAADIAAVQQLGIAPWIDQQIALPATPIPTGLTGSVEPVRNTWMILKTAVETLEAAEKLDWKRI